MDRWLVATLILLVLVPTTRGRAQAFEQEITPFPVRDTAGHAYEMPFLGGFNTPRPKLVDIDRDGDLDLFVQERRGRLIYFENVGTTSDPKWRWRTDHYADLDVGAWARFGDLDDDGDPDLLAEEPISKVRYYQNGGTSDGPDFQRVASPLSRANGESLFADRQNVPALAAMDCQGAPDFLSGGLNGRLRFFRHTGTESGDVPVFRFVSDEYQSVCVGPSSVCGTSSGSVGGERSEKRHGANALAVGDVEPDGDPDILWGDFFSRSLYFLKNTGSCAAPNLERASDVYPVDNPIRTSGFNAPALGDLDADQDLDLLIGVLGGSGGDVSAIENFLYLENTSASSNPSYALQTRRLLSTVDVGTESIPALVDLNGNGRRDLVIGNSTEPGRSSSRLHLFRNVGSTGAPVFAARPDSLLTSVEAGFNFAPAFADVDADGTQDLFLGTFSGTVRFYRNHGSDANPEFRRDESMDVELPRGNLATPAIVDIDADGDQDLFVGSASAEGSLALFRNDGTPSAPAFTLAQAQYQAIESGESRTHPSFADMDGDGDFDLLLGMQDGISLYRNTGTPAKADFRGPSDSLSIPLRSFAAPAVADLDMDQRPDLVVGGESGGLKYFSGTGTPIGPAVSPGGGVLVAPNPFSASTRLIFSIEETSRVQLTIYDVMGRRVSVLLDRRLERGPQYVPFRGRNRASGLYLYVLRVGDRVRDRGRLMLVR